jgi:hypothetical protein
MGSEEPFQILIDSLRNEAKLSGVGAILARMELIRAIRGRKALVGWSSSTNGEQSGSDSPSSLAPLFIIGGARSGTSALLRHLGNWHDVRAPSTVEILHPEVLDSDPPGGDLVRSVTLQDRLWDLLDPSFSSQHLNRGDLPSECLPIFSCGFQSHHWTGCYRVPSLRQVLSGLWLRERFGFSPAVCISPWRDDFGQTSHLQVPCIRSHSRRTSEGVSEGQVSLPSS